MDLSIFKDYDVRGKYPDQINGEVASAVATAIVQKFSPKTVCICRDMRISGNEIFTGMSRIFVEQGINVFDAGLTGTEVAYYIAGTKSYDMVIMISASHNPPEYNGFKVVLRGPIAVTSDTGLYDVRDLIAKGPLPPATTKGIIERIDIWKEWKEKILSLIDIPALKPLSVVVDAGNGMAGKMVPITFDGLPMKVTPLFFDLDGRFPNHVPNPLIEKNNNALIAKIKEIGADIGLTFDGDADRLFLVDDKGRIVSGTITTALVAKYILAKHPGELILYNAICGRIVPKTIQACGGTSKRVRVGHSYIKQFMKETGAIFAGEHSGHYYLREYFRAESGQAVALMVLALLSSQSKKLSELVDELNVYPASGEINFVVADFPATTLAIKNGFSDAQSIDELDGISVWYTDYWFNVRASKTEPLLRLNVEADTKELLDSKTKELITKIESLGGKRK
jgi:phosphomannomutase